jgi:hypothetical protein
VFDEPASRPVAQVFIDAFPRRADEVAQLLLRQAVTFARPRSSTKNSVAGSPFATIVCLGLYTLIFASCDRRTRSSFASALKRQTRPRLSIIASATVFNLRM